VHSGSGASFAALEMRPWGTRGRRINHLGNCLGDLGGFQICAIEHRQTKRPVEDSIGDRFLCLGWITTRSEPCPALAIGTIEEEPFAIWPIAQLLRSAHAEQDDIERPDLVNDGSYQMLVASPGLRCLPDGNACQSLGGTHERVPI
jgi:hypothetical protein